MSIVQGAFLPVPPVAGGAVEKLWFELGKEIARRGVDVQHLSRRWPGLPSAEIIAGVQHRRVRGYAYPGSALVAMALDFAHSLRCLVALDPGDVVVTNTFFLPMLLRLRPAIGRVYVSVHRFPRGQMRWYGNAARLQCVSHAVAEAVRRQSPAVAAKVAVIPNYVPAGLAENVWETLWPTRRNEILFVGRLHPEKGLDLLLDAWAGIDPVRRKAWSLRVVGPHRNEAGGGGDAYLAALQRKAASLDLLVDWSGPVYDTQALTACYARARVFVYPSVASGEAFGLAPLEAMAQGCAVVTSDLACFADFIDPGVNAERFSLGDGAVAALQACLLALMHDPPRQQRLGRAALATARRFGIARIADAFIADFQALSAP